MTSTNRADRIEQLYKVLKKHYKPTTIATDRPVLDLLLYACCLEDARFEAADEAFAKLQQSYFDWNEVRVTTIAELAEVLSSLPAPGEAAARIKNCLQSLFESRYSFEIDELRKANLGKTVAEMEAWKGVSKFVVGFVTQSALGGHAIPIDNASMEVMKLMEIVTPNEATKGVVPGLERTIAKSKAPEFSTLLHQFAAEFRASAKSPLALTVFKELGVNPKPKPAPPPPPPPAPKKAPEPPKAAPKTASKAAPVEPVAKKTPTKDSAPKLPPVKAAPVKPAPTGKGPLAEKLKEAKKAPKAEPKKPEVKKPEVKKEEEKKAASAPKKPAAPAKPPAKAAPRKPVIEVKKGNTKKPAPSKGTPASNPKSKSKSKPIASKITKKKPK
ncbi:MAG: hypothetical protein U0905_19530 [Pirellulales bacterium]